jgi:hypothetical protein
MTASLIKSKKHLTSTKGEHLDVRTTDPVETEGPVNGSFHSTENEKKHLRSGEAISPICL